METTTNNKKAILEKIMQLSEIYNAMETLSKSKVIVSTSRVQERNAMFKLLLKYWKIKYDADSNGLIHSNIDNSTKPGAFI